MWKNARLHQEIFTGVGSNREIRNITTYKYTWQDDNVFLAQESDIQWNSRFELRGKAENILNDMNKYDIMTISEIFRKMQ